MATLLVFSFAFSRSSWRWMILILEAGGLFLLAKTYSRGAVLAWIFAWAYGLAATEAWRSSARRSIWIARFCVLALALIATDFDWRRDSESKIIFAASPTIRGSAANRLTLWQGGLEMLAAAPLSGWGAGESGRVYMNWFQELNRDEGYSTMVNSYLSVAIEYGLPALAAALFSIVWLLAVGWNVSKCAMVPDDCALSTLRPRLALATGAAIMVWATANFFTTLWIEPKLWIAPGCSAAVLVWISIRSEHAYRDRVSCILLGVGLTAGTLSSLYGVGCALSWKRLLRIEPGLFGSTIVKRNSPKNTVDKVWHIWPDVEVLGPTPGKEIRRWFENDPLNSSLVVHNLTSPQVDEETSQTDSVLLAGRQVERLNWRCREIWLVHPLGTPPKKPIRASQIPRIFVVVPSTDETGNVPAWRNWSKQVGGTIVESPSCGLDIRIVWPAIMKIPNAIP